MTVSMLPRMRPDTRAKVSRSAAEPVEARLCRVTEPTSWAELTLSSFFCTARPLPVDRPFLLRCCVVNLIGPSAVTDLTTFLPRAPVPHFPPLTLPAAQYHLL